MMVVMLQASNEEAANEKTQSEKGRETSKKKTINWCQSNNNHSQKQIEKKWAIW